MTRQVWCSRLSFPDVPFCDSGAPEGEISEDSPKSLDTEPEVTSKREQGEDAVVLLETDSDLEDDEARDREVPEKKTMSFKKERRKTLEEYFLDPPELAVENAFQIPGLNSVWLHCSIVFYTKAF